MFRLHFNDRFPIKQLAQRFRLKSCTLYHWVDKLDKIAPNLTALPTQPHRFKKMHDRTKDFISDYIDEAKVPILVKGVKDAVKSEVKLSLSRWMVNCYLRDELGLSYRKIKPINDAHNKQQAKLQR